MARLLVAGDIMPAGANEAVFRAGDSAAILGDLLPVFHGADLVVGNLECPLLDAPSPVAKSGPVLGVTDDCVHGLEAMGVDVLGLANNHIMDHGPSGLNSTLDACKTAGIACVGAGPDLESASRISVHDVGGCSVGVLALAEHEFGIAGRTESGVCPLDPVVFIRVLLSQKDQYDALIVLIHGGNEFYPYPRPSLQRMCRLLAELGATLVVCQHSHIVGCHEEYHGSHIVYGQGNFIFAGNGKPACWHEGLLLSLEIGEGSSPAVEWIPVVQGTDGSPGTRRMAGSQRKAFEEGFRKRSQEVMDPLAVEARWNDYCQQQKDLYLRRLGSPHRLFRLVDKFTGLIRYLEQRPRIRLDHLNLVRCESHREVLINILENK